MYLFIAQTHFTNVQVQLEDIVKLEDQDSDYESMSSDSSMKKDEKGVAGVLCPSSGRLLLEEPVEVKEEVETGFRQPESLISQKDKLKYLRYFRLVTHRKKNEVEIEKLEKRKSRMRERSPSPLPAPAPPCPASPLLPLPSTPPHLNRLPETHAKAMYLSAIGLCRVGEESKQAGEVVWGAILEDRMARDPDTTINQYFSQLRALCGPNPDRGMKRSWEGEARTVALSIPSPAPHLPPDLGLSNLQPVARPTLLLGDPTPAPPAHHHPALSRPAPAPDCQPDQPEDLTVGKKRKLSCGLAWPGVDALVESYHRFTAGNNQNQLPNTHNLVLHSPPVHITVKLTAHISECAAEKAVLAERSARAQGEIAGRRGQVDTLSTRLSSLARLHQTLVSNHQHAATSLASLRATLQRLQPTPAN